MDDLRSEIWAAEGSWRSLEWVRESSEKMLSLSDVTYSSELWPRRFFTAVSEHRLAGRRRRRDPELGRDDDRELAPETNSMGMETNSMGMETNIMGMETYITGMETNSMGMETNTMGMDTNTLGMEKKTPWSWKTTQ